MDPSRRQRTIGILQILLSGFCFGFLGLLGKTAYATGVQPAELLSLRFGLAGIMLLTYFAIRHPKRLRLPRSHVIWSVLLGSLGYAVFSFCYFRALTGLSASLTVLLLYLYPVTVAAGAWLFLGEDIPKGRWFVLPIAMLGLVLLVWGDFHVETALAFGFGVASSVLYAVYILCSRKFLAGSDPLVSAGIMQISAGVALGLFTWRDPARMTEVISSTWPALVALSLVCSIAAMSLFLYGLQKLKSWEVSILSTSEPITAILVAYVMLGERLGFLQLLGGLLVILAFIFVSLPSRRSEGGSRHGG